MSLLRSSLTSVERTLNLFQERAININNFSVLKHNDRGKAHALMASHCEMEIERDDQKVPKMATVK